MADDALSYGEKVELLESWGEDKEAYMRASEEGMPGRDRAQLLSNIENAFIELHKRQNELKKEEASLPSHRRNHRDIE